jgi:hypothetical protein
MANRKRGRLEVHKANIVFTEKQQTTNNKQQTTNNKQGYSTKLISSQGCCKSCVFLVV